MSAASGLRLNQAAPGGRLLTALAGLATALLFSCLGIGESALRVTGHVLSPPAEPVDSCKIQLYNATDAQLLQEKHVTSSFTATFLIDPQKHEYYLVVDCGERGKFQSDTLELPRRKGFKDPIQLGGIPLEK